MGHDLDLVARGKAWELAALAGTVEVPRSGVGHVISLFEGQIEVYDSWTPGDWDVNELIKTAEITEGIRFARLEDVIKWKKVMGRPKDTEHLAMIKQCLASGGK